jgi:hypothetical protein
MKEVKTSPVALAVGSAIALFSPFCVVMRWELPLALHIVFVVAGTLVAFANRLDSFFEGKTISLPLGIKIESKEDGNEKEEG